MANAGATVTGLKEAQRAVAQLDQTVQDALQRVAAATAARVLTRAQALVPFDSGITHDSIQIVPQPEEQQYRVEVGAAPAHRRKGRTAFLPNLPIWLEYGTRTMRARPFMRPAFDAEHDRYIRDMEQAALGALGEALR
jgi:HK97 gp10 family phage protein